jgi:hypothetical protein
MKAFVVIEPDGHRFRRLPAWETARQASLSTTGTPSNSRAARHCTHPTRVTCRQLQCSGVAKYGECQRVFLHPPARVMRAVGRRVVLVIPVVMAAPTTADKGSGARLRAGSARGMACRQMCRVRGEGG